MYARVTHFDIDTVIIGMSDAVARFEAHVLPTLRAQPGYCGVCVLHNAEGRGLLVSYWESEEKAADAVASGFYDEQLRKFVTFYRQAPEREQFEVALLESPASLAAGSGRR
ncbi:MAG: hypothetical protein HYX53_02725 [Chloroflexi bacterium]|nr:hypothetical protein [Chloroflexota bacterium]